MKRPVKKLFFVLMFVCAFTFAIKAQTIAVSGSVDKSSIKRGVVGKGSIVLIIPKELHINSNKPTSEFMIPTALKLSSNQVKITKIIYPKGKNQKFDFSDEAINVYEGKTVIPFKFTVPKNLKNKTITIRALVSYQGCTNEVCYQPQKKEIILKGVLK
jgi:hypothetical protein